MKLAAVILFLFLMGCACGQAPYEFSTVVKVDSTLAKDQIYYAVKRWFVDTFKDSEKVIQMEDPESATIVGKGNMPFATSIYLGSATRKGRIDFTIEVAAKQGRLRLRMYSFEHHGTPGTQYGAINLGTIYASDTCSQETRPLEGMKFRLRVCMEEVWPQVHLYEKAFALGLREAVNNYSQSRPSGTSDW